MIRKNAINISDIYNMLPDGKAKKHFKIYECIDIAWYIKLNYIYDTDEEFKKFVKGFIQKS